MLVELTERTTLLQDEAEVLRLIRIENKSYDETSQLTGWSRGRIYALLLRTGARKTEARIMERQAERRQRQEESLRAILNTTQKADVLDFLESLPDESVSLVVTSVPYNLGKSYGGGPSADTMRYSYFHGFLMMIVSELARVLKPGGTLFLQVGQTRDWEAALYPMDAMLFEDVRRSGLTFCSRVVWTVPYGLTPKRRLAERYETAIVASKGEQLVFNATPARRPQKQPGKRAFKGPNKGQLSCHPFGSHPTNVWDDIGHLVPNHHERAHGMHPAQFPLALARRAILLYSMPGDVVLDCFCGSGTTQEAAYQTGRAFIGCDLFYEEIRAKRMAAAEADTYSMLPGVSDEAVAVWQAEAVRVSHPAPNISLVAKRASPKPTGPCSTKRGLHNVTGPGGSCPAP